ncbi:Daple [Paractinoplanes toevensis]|uniref:Daple n=1 Tax=Paractinoplanes toevensis TaxID=571911 RepID=UPI001BB323D6|nr:Daple [Actinoplanes toevensis]
MTQDSPWSNAGAPLDAENDVPAWRRPTPFPRNQAFPPPDRGYSPVQPAPVQPTAMPPAPGAPGPVPAPTPPGFVDAKQSGEIPSSVSPAAETERRWAEARPRYSDLLAHLTPPGGEPARPPSPRTEPPSPPPRGIGESTGAPITRPAEPGLAPRSALPEPGLAPRSVLPEPGLAPRSVPPEPGLVSRGNTPATGRPTSLRSAEPSRYDLPTPNSAPPYPYEGDLDEPSPTPVAAQQRAAVPLVRPAAPAARRADWSAPEPPRPQSPAPYQPQSPVSYQPQAAVPYQSPAPPSPSTPADESPSGRPSYDPSSFPRRVSYESGPAAEPSGYVPPPAYAAFGSRPTSGAGASGSDETGSRVLPQRVPAQPDVPKVPEPPLTEPTAETPALARIATHLRRGDVLQPRERQEGFDVQAILAAVRGVDGVRDASLRSTPSGAHSLRLDLAEGADPAEVSRRVARLLQDRMGLDAAMQGETPPAPPPPPPAAPVSPAALAPIRQRTTPPPAPEVQPVPEPPAPLVERVRPPREERPVERPEPPRRAEKPEPRVEETAVAEVDDEPGPPRPLFPGEHPGPRIVIENVHVNTYGTDASVEVQLAVGGRTASGVADGPAVDGYLLRLCATATVGAVNDLLSESDHPDGPARCYVEHAAAVPFGNSQVAVVVLLLSCNSWVEQLAGSSVVSGDDRHAMVRATLAAVNRRLEALLSR